MFSYRLFPVGMLTLMLSLFHAGTPAHALDPRLELDPGRLNRNSPAAAGVSPEPATSPSQRTSSEQATYTIKTGDYLMKILIREYGMKSDAAEALVPKILQLNHISDFRRLKIGDRIIIPLPSREARHQTKRVTTPQKQPMPPSKEQSTGMGLSLKMPAPSRVNGRMDEIRQVWKTLVPGTAIIDKPLSIKGKNYALDLDPSSFPVLPAADGRKIVVETGAGLSPLVKTLIQENDPKIQFVNYSQLNGKRSFSNLLAAAGFYSVKEDFNVEFESDPKLSVLADFKVEKNENSILENDISLINIDPRLEVLPGCLTDYLGTQGMHVAEINPSPPREIPLKNRHIQVIAEKEPSAIADRLMEALGIEYSKEKEVVLDIMDGGGALRINVDRYFERNGEKYVVSKFNGDLIAYTLLRLLETIRYNVIWLDPKENFPAVAQKFLSRIRLPHNRITQDLVESRSQRYKIHMSGIMLKNPANQDKLILTSAKPSGVISELLRLNGYSISQDRGDLPLSQ